LSIVSCQLSVSAIHAR